MSGYKVEYAGAPFALFFIGEYANIIFINLITVVLFLGTSSSSLALFKVFVIATKVMGLVFSFL